MKKITLYDVAKKSGVSPKTVSRVINNEASVSDHKRDAVLKAVQSLGYRPNNSARSLRNNRAYAIGLLYDNLSPAYILDLQAGLLSACEKAQFNLLIKPCDIDHGVLLKHVTNLLDNSRVDGFVLSPPISDDPLLIGLLKSRECPFVRIAPLDTAMVSPYVSVNDFELSQEITHYLLSLGHERIGFIEGDSSHKASIERLNGYKQALSDAGVTLKKTLIKQGDFSFESGEACARRLLSQVKPPSAVFACNDYMAAGVVKAAQRLGMSVPEQLSVVGFDDAPVSRQLWPTLTTVRQPVQEIAATSAELLLDIILNKKQAEQAVQLECELVVRESTAKCLLGH